MKVSCVTPIVDPSWHRLSVRSNDVALAVRYEPRADLLTAFDEATTPHREQMIRKLRKTDRLPAKGEECLRWPSRWRLARRPTTVGDQYGGLKADDAKRLKELTAENARLTRLLAEGRAGETGPAELAKMSLGI
jgi:putative transposase